MPENSPARIPRILIPSATLAAAALVILGTAAPASAAEGLAYDTLTVSAEPLEVSVGQTVTVTAAATGLVDAYAYDLDISYDPALLAFVDSSEVTPDGGFGSASDDGSSVAVVATRLGTSPGLAGDQTLVTLTFTALAAGDAEIALTSGQFVDSSGAATEVDATAETLLSTVVITADEETGGGSAEGSAEGSADADGTDGSGEQPTTGSNTEDGSLATTGGDAATWLLVGGAAAVVVLAGSALLVIRRRTR
jgi:LPXTG-motif cell wall-anchored protein